MAGGRTHQFLPHTADAGFAARAPDLAGLFEETALALAALAADTESTSSSAVVPVGPLVADDLAGLAFAWLNELLGVAEVKGLALFRATVSRLERVPAGLDHQPEWLIAGRAWLAAYGPKGVRARRHVKAVTFHRLSVEEGAEGWTLTAYADL